MFRFFVCINLILVHVFCQTTDDISQFNTDFVTSPSWQQDTTEQSLRLDINYDTTQSEHQGITEELLNLSTDTDTSQSGGQITTEEPAETSTDSGATQIWETFTTGQPSEQDNFTTTTQQMTSTMTTTNSTTCPSSIVCNISEETKQEIIDTVLLAVTSEITNQLEAMEAHLSALIYTYNGNSSAIQLSWQIYENLQIPLIGWLRVFDYPYSHKTRIDDLNQIAGICHNDVLVGATFNRSIVLAAVGPASVLTLNTMWNRSQQVGQVYWYRSDGRSFGFSPHSTIRQTTGDNEDMNSPLRLSWLLDQNMGGYRAGATRPLADDSLWHKVIYCN
jgi:hypothetical protein